MDTSQDPRGSLVSGNGLDLHLLQRLAARPRLYSGRDLSFWTDPYVAEHVLEAHLDPHTDDASRRPARIAGTVETILSHVKRSELTDEHRPRMLDLACGPGLYAQQFASHGFSVTGIDFSEVSIRHAREEAEREGLDIEYRREDLTTAKLGGPYDVVTLIYGEFCTFSERERRKLLRRIRKSLAPGGLFVVDVFTEAYVRRNRSCDDWYVSAADGFWQASPHMVLLRHFFYPADSASVARYTIVDENGSYRQFNVWWRHYDAGEIRELMDSEGFDVEQLYGSLWGEAYDPNGEWIGVYARAAT